MPNKIQDIHKVDTDSFPYIFEQNITIPLKAGSGLIRCNVYRPKATVAGNGGEKARYPVLVTYGPYGKDISYQE
jgi:hypothetical protein